jgi:hypothetical protein
VMRNARAIAGLVLVLLPAAAAGFLLFHLVIGQWIDAAPAGAEFPLSFSARSGESFISQTATWRPADQQRPAALFSEELA